jgi:hypothetical protein
LNSFIEGVINASVLSSKLTSLLTLDTTSVPSLKEIKVETKNDYSNNGRVLY